MAGDLNDILDTSEKFGGAPFNLYRSGLFQQRINDCHLMDLGFSGPPFTWLGAGRGW